MGRARVRVFPGLGLLVTGLGGVSGSAKERDSFWEARELPDWETDGYRPQPVPDDELPENKRAPPPLSTRRIDEHGVVRWRARDGRWVNHPLVIARYGVRMADGWRLTGKPEYLRRAEANAQRLLDVATTSRGALWFPYPFDWANHRNRNDMMLAPWYSQMAQGAALMLFSRLHRVTGEGRWRSRAKKTFKGFLLPPRLEQPWGVFVDGAGYLWLEEYPKDPPMRALNGHIFAAFGLFDYIRETGDERALEVWDGALATVRVYASEFRQPGGPSLYCLRVRKRSSTYHRAHIDFLDHLAKQSGDSFFGDQARLWESDVE
jgi:D-glucuronyl C5-epimerase C-terminus